MNGNLEFNDVFIIVAILAFSLLIYITLTIKDNSKKLTSLTAEVKDNSAVVKDNSKKLTRLTAAVKDNSKKLSFLQQNGIPYMIDFWDRTIGLTGGLKITTNERKRVYKFYGVDNQNGGRKCMFTGLIVPDICIAHLIPRRCPGWAFESLNIDPGHRNHPKNTLVLCKSVEELFDLKLISFYKVEGQFMMRIWDKKVEEIPIYKNSDQKMRDFKNEVLKIDGKSPYTRILNHHHKMCARFHGDLDTARKSSFGTPCTKGSKYPVERMALKTFYYDNPPNKYPDLCSDEYPNPCSDEF